MNGLDRASRRQAKGLRHEFNAALLFWRVHLQTAGREPGVQFEAQPTGLDCRVGISQGARLIHGIDFENKHSPEIAVVAEGTGHREFAQFPHLPDICHVPLLNTLGLRGAFGGPVGPPVE